MYRRFLVVVAGLGAVFFLLTACGERALADPRLAPPLVRIALVQASVDSTRSFSGTVAARVQSDLGFRVTGKVTERLANAGQTVKRGQLLMRMDATDLALATRAQEESVASAQARATQTANEEARYRDLRGTGAISALSYEQVKAASDSAQAQLRAAQAQAAMARNLSRYTHLTADVDGVVIDTLAEPGQVVSAGQTVIRIAHAGRREAVIQLPETLRPAIGSAGQACIFGGQSAPVSVRLRQLSTSADRLTRTFEARYVLEGALANAPLGATVTVQLADPTGDTGGVWIPLAALFDLGRGAGVWVVQGQPSTVTRRAVSVQRLQDEHAQITGQIQPGEQIVALGAHLLSEGQPVRLADPATAAPAGKATP